jgi:hypothetical protein
MKLQTVIRYGSLMIGCVTGFVAAAQEDTTRTKVMEKVVVVGTRA